MSPSNPDTGARDGGRFQLSWPGDATRSDQRRPTGRRVASEDRPDDDRAVVIDRETDAYSGALPVSGVEAAGASALRRAVVDAYDRLAERLLQRLRAVGEDMDADLAELRSEMASLRQAVEDLSDRVQLRQMRSSIDEVRTDLVGLRREVLERPDLERISADLTGLRADVARLLARAPERAPLRPSDAGVGPLADEVSALREELTGELASLRRRIALRGDGTTKPSELTDAQVERLAGAVAERLATRAGRLRPR